MRIVVWNIERGYHAAAICRQLKELDADLYLLSELDCGNMRTGWVDMFGLIQETLQMPGHFAREFHELQSLWRFVLPVGGPGGGVHGNAIFSRLPMTNYRELRLPTNERLDWTGQTVVPELFEPRVGSRVAQLVDLEWDGLTVGILNTHLENWRGSWELRRQQLEATFSACRTGPKILGGDLNPIEHAWQSLPPLCRVPPEIPKLRAFLKAREMTDPFSDDEPTCFPFQMELKLDWLAVSSHFTVVQRENIRTEYSDHNILVVDVKRS